jgi:hypothetical protein
MYAKIIQSPSLFKKVLKKLCKSKYPLPIYLRLFGNEGRNRVARPYLRCEVLQLSMIYRQFYSLPGGFNLNTVSGK